MKENKGNKFLLDGFPRNQDNIDGWNKEVGDTATVKKVLCFDVSEDVMRERLLKRGETSGRADDNEEAIQKRFVTFKDETVPVMEQYQKKGLLAQIDAGKSVDEVFEDVKKELQ